MWQQRIAGPDNILHVCGWPKWMHPEPMGFGAAGATGAGGSPGGEAPPAAAGDAATFVIPDLAERLSTRRLKGKSLSFALTERPDFRFLVSANPVPRHSDDASWTPLDRLQMAAHLARTIATRMAAITSWWAMSGRLDDPIDFSNVFRDAEDSILNIVEWTDVQCGLAVWAEGLAEAVTRWGFAEGIDRSSEEHVRVEGLMTGGLESWWQCLRRRDAVAIQGVLENLTTRNGLLTFKSSLLAHSRDPFWTMGAAIVSCKWDATRDDLPQLWRWANSLDAGRRERLVKEKAVEIKSAKRVTERAAADRHQRSLEDAVVAAGRGVGQKRARDGGGGGGGGEGYGKNAGGGGRGGRNTGGRGGGGGSGRGGGGGSPPLDQAAKKAKFTDRLKGIPVENRPEWMLAKAGGCTKCRQPGHQVASCTAAAVSFVQAAPQAASSGTLAST